MARLCDDAQNEYLSYGGAVLSVEPITMACWYNTDTEAVNQTLICLGNNDTFGMWRLAIMGGVANDPVRAQKQSDAGGTTGSADKTDFAVNTWQHAAAVFVNDTSRFSYLDGVVGAESNTDVADPTPDFTSIGVIQKAALSQYLSGRIAWPAMWNVALSGDEIASLAAGWHPDVIRPDARVSFLPLGGLDTPETDGGTARDIWGGLDFAAFSDATGPGVADHPGGLIYPSAGIVVPVTVSPAVGNPWYHYAQQEAAA